MSLRDEVRYVLGSGERTKTIDELMQTIERALTAERAALKADIYDRLAQPLQAIIVEAGLEGEEDVERAIERFAKELHDLNTDRSALDAMLAQARAEGELAMFDQFWDLAAIHYGVPAGQHSPESLLHEVARAILEEAKAAIRAQKD